MKGSGYRRIVHQYPLTKEQKKEIDDFFIRNYGRKIPYDQHRYYAAHSGVFNAQFFPRYIYRAYFERFMNLERSYNRVFQDKNVLPYLAKVAGVSMPRTIVSLSKGLYRDGNYNVIKYRDVVELLREGGKLFCKPSRGSFGGRSCFSEDFRNENIDIDSVLKSLGSEFVIQETVRCDPSIRAVYPNAVNTFRITTYRWKDDFFYIPAAMRIGHGGAELDNASTGGMFVSISDDGHLIGCAVTKNNKKYSEHPDSHVIFDGYKINNYEKVREAALKMHTMMPQIGVAGWDFTIDENGFPILIEVNIGMVGFEFCQNSLGIPAFGDHTAEILQWIRKMKQIPYKKRSNYAFGKM